METKTSDVEQLRKLLKDGRHERITHVALACAILEIADSIKWKEATHPGRSTSPLSDFTRDLSE